jgi:hypothetical protein
MLQKFKSLDELVQYLATLEERVQYLEEENHRLRSLPVPAPAPQGLSTTSVDERTIAKMVASFLPLTNIVHPSFLKRAFAIWGHFFVANFIISIPFTILYFCLLTLALRGSLQTP